MRRRLISLMAALAIGTVGAFAFAAPSSASTFSCNFPNAPEVTSLSKAAAEDKVEEALPRFGKCLEIVWTDQCDGMTFVSMTNWVKDDNDWTVLTVKLNGKEYTLKGGSSPNTEEALIGPKVTDVQAYLVFNLKNGTHIEVPFEKPHTWVDPGAVCPSPSPTPSPSVSASASPSAVPSGATGPLYANCDAAVAAGAAPINRGEPGYSTDLDGDNDGVACESGDVGSPSLPVTGASLTFPLATGVTALILAGAVSFVLYRRRRAHESQ